MSAKDCFKFLFLGLVWGSSFLWIKIALAQVGPLVLVLFRTGLVFLGLGVIVNTRKITPLPLPTIGEEKIEGENV